jgi:hypothetical protein
MHNGTRRGRRQIGLSLHVSKRIDSMLDKVTMINLVWTAMIGAMLATSITFHMKDQKMASMYGPQITASYDSFNR